MDYKKTAEYCKAHWQAECEKTISFADLVCENTFLFNRPCDLERTETPVHFDGEIDWDYILDGDCEFLFQLNRHQFLISLGQAYYLTGDRKYGEAFTRLWTDWLTRVPPDGGGVSPWRTLEVGMRGEHWTKAARYFENTEFFTEELKQLYRASVEKHTEILKESHNMHLKGSNWGIIQDSGLFALSLELGNSADAFLALRRLSEECRLQLMSDGVHWEQSGGYHIAVLSCLLNVARLAAERRIILSKSLWKSVNALASVCQKWIKPDFHQPLSGDSDDNDLRNIMSLSALVLGRPELKFSGYETLDYDSAWLFGEEGIEKYSEMTAENPDFLNAYLEDSGTYILRSDWSENANWLRFQNGYTGGGHAHADKLHFDLMLGGKDILVDGGRYTYVFNEARKFFKSAEGHNTITVGKKGFLNMSGAWEFKDKAPSLQYPVFETDDCVLLGGAHKGYKNTLVERRILHIKPDIYIIIDFADGHRLFYPKAHQHFHFSPNGKAEISGNTVLFTDGEVTAEMHFFSDNLKLKKAASEFSPWYNKKMTNDAVASSFSRRAVTVIYGGRAEKFERYSVKRASSPDARAEYIEIEAPKHKYTVALAFEELMSTFAAGENISSGMLSVYRDGEKIFTRY